MAKFVLAGKADCPYYAKAELLADSLQRNLPDFHVHKICLQPADWKDWLEETCSSRGWKHESCPIVWRELIDRGGKGMLLGGFSDFLEFVQDYYGITSDMRTELMLKIAEENLQATELRLEEEARQRNSLKVFHIWISSALNCTCYSLIPLLFTTGVFRDMPTISLHLLDMDSCEESLLGLKMEVEDLALPQLHQVTVHSDLTQAFQSADVIIFLDEWPSNIAEQEEQEDKEHTVRLVAELFDRYGRLIEANAQKDVKVIVSGGTYINLKCALLIENAPSVNPSRFVALATQLECEARAQLAEKLSVKTSDITDVIIWGNISGTSHIDLQRAKVLRYKGAIWGPTGFSQQVLEMVYDKKWLANDFLSLVGSRRSSISLKMNRTAAISATNGILAVLNAWNNGSSPEEVFSLGVVSTGHFGVPAGLVFSLPVRFQDGDWSVCSDITISEELRNKLEAIIHELTEEKDVAGGMKQNRPVD
ncbi:LOW QUALITY PROTEIN: putative malate dehydrogenase 1B [Colossoma macropomum]|uniref:LOW QUALITY PROTEIN: putative malate dehydrogenase 1B n=1 Tax=Colossoma macropomum TaxID=42526 RepID=UPI001864F172|nr:LOW QUALITY PROTEIN: putative malate dehydrogenase 1B [Colossoma macropomum]